MSSVANSKVRASGRVAASMGGSRVFPIVSYRLDSQFLVCELKFPSDPEKPIDDVSINLRNLLHRSEASDITN